MLLGIFLGFMGNLFRVFAELLRFSYDCKVNKKDYRKEFDWKRWLMSVPLSFVVGLYAVSQVITPSNPITKEQIIAISMFSYAMCHFVEIIILNLLDTYKRNKTK